MRMPPRQTTTGTARLRGAGWLGIAWASIGLVFAACSSTPPLRDPAPSSDPPRYSLVFIIHGDGDYIFSDPDGNTHRADETILASARAVAEKNPHAEVFVFHQKPRTHRLFVFPRRDGHAYYYRNGQLLVERSYWRDDGENRFDPELAIYDELATTEPLARMFFYFGHEIPEFGGAGYDASYPERPFTVYDMSRGLARIAHDTTKVDLVVLGTCYGGTPYTINALAPHARFIVASPENLHRSYFDLKPLEGLDNATDVPAFANEFARHAFETLAAEVQTAVGVVVYNADSVRAYTGEAEAAYVRGLTDLEGRSRGTVEHCDCAEDSAFALPRMDEGLTVFYRAARFGRLKTKLAHSGWACWKEEEKFATSRGGGP